MISKRAIELAIQGGWDGEWENVLGPIEHRGTENACGWEPVSLSSAFWQALGKSCGWEEKWQHLRKHGTEWQDVACEFVNLILVGGSTDEFWEEVLNAIP